MRFNGELRILRKAIGAFAGDVIDVGANTGQWATTVAPYAEGRMIHSFEPVPAIYAELQRTVAPWSNIRAIPAGLGDQAKTLELNYSPESSTISSAYPLLWGGDGAERVECDIRTGDEYLATNGIDAVALLKIDVEGMEAATLKGFEQAFTAGRIASVQFEHGPAHVHSGHTLGYFNELFGGLGYQLYYVFPRRLKRLQYDLLRDGFHGQNFFAVRRDLAAAVEN
jgi:FkbM family methyltransferase